MTERPWLCPRDHTCTAPRHDDWQGHRRGCRSGKARESARVYRKRLRVGTALDLRGVPSIGTRRRLQALYAIGWTWRGIAERLDVKEEYPRHLATGRQSPETCFRSTADAVAALYDELATVPGPSKRSVTIARRYGWVTCMAWTNIDDPDDQPDLGGVDKAHDENVIAAIVAGRVTWAALSDADRDHLVATLFRRGWDTATIAERATADVDEVRRVHERVRARQRRAAA